MKDTSTEPSLAVAVPIIGASGTPDGVALFDAADSDRRRSAFVACTVHVTAVPFGTITLIGEDVPVPVKGPPVPLQVAVKPVIVLPPSNAGPVKATSTEPSPAVAVPIVGASGTPVGVALFDAADSNESPLAFVACTVHVTAVPFGTVTETGETVLVPVYGPPVPLTVAVKPVMRCRHRTPGPVKLTSTEPSLAVAVPIVGASGTPDGVALFDAANSRLCRRSRWWRAPCTSPRHRSGRSR